ncbi:hypothetical protein KOI35_46545 [Actinoplanes bogorensis]|uniref:Uncharacterized protein n=1 Tax=Paractinoplanes bogorensis TaxID=1610840 RepID=A0ABS5Z7S5_9ACTN|nr:hypothetical protein [Actinoplanes bogorensis]MBU2670983.1 hypothetical protein [Actinoplanes bogorensis]
MTSMNRAVWVRPLLAAGVAVAALTATAAGPAQAAPAPTRFSARAALAAEASFEQKLAVAVKFGRGDDSALIEKADRDFVVAIWNLVKDNPDQAEVRLAAEAAFSAEPVEEDSVDQACYQFIVTGVYAAFDRDVARVKREADEKRARDLARTAAAASIDVVADAALLNGSDADFVRLIWERVSDDVKWPKVKAAARAAREGSDADRTAFIAAGMAAAAGQDVDDRIAADEAKTEAEKAAERSRAAKKLAANRILMPVTDELLSLPDRDFVTVVWNFADDGTEVQAAAIVAARSLDPAVWKAFIDTGIHAAKDRDIAIGLAKAEAEDRRLVQAIVDRAVANSQRGLATAARAALAGDAAAVADFLRVGQYQVGQDVTQFALTTTRLGMLTADGTAYVKEGGIDATWVKMYTNVKQLALSGNRIGVLTTAGVALVKEGGLSAGWVTEQTAVKQLVLSGNRIGVIRTDNAAYVKEGGLSALWTKVYSGVTQLAMSGTRIGVLRTDKAALVKEGTVASTGWATEHTSVKQLVLSGTRIGVLRTDNIAWVKEGGLSAGWVNEHNAVAYLALAGTRIGVVHTDGIVRVKEGGLSALWTQVGTNSYTMALETNRIARIANDGVGYVNDGAVSAPFTTFKMAPSPS